MFKNVKEVELAPESVIRDLISKSCDVELSDILDEDSTRILNQAGDIKIRAEKIAFAIRDRFKSIVENSEDDSEEEDPDGENQDEFMNTIAAYLDQEYNGEYEYRPDYFWIPSSC